MLITGVSNTNEAMFGLGVGTAGEKYPGKRIKAAKIHQIDLRDSASYSNITISYLLFVAIWSIAVPYGTYPLFLTPSSLKVFSAHLHLKLPV